MIHPLDPLACKGAIWYQGENRETTSQSTDSYFLKEKGLQQGWKRAFGLDDFALYVVLLANYLDPPSGSNVAPDMPGATWADTRIQQMNVLGMPHAGVGSAIDIGDAANIHPTDKLDVGERLAIWALKNDYGRTTLVPSGPVLNNVTVSGNKATCTFDYVGAGLMVGSKTPYQPTQEVVGGTLARFSIAGSNGTWYDATAVINGSTVELTSTSVSAPTKVAYACWTNPAGANLYNRDGLPAAPFYVDDVTAKSHRDRIRGIGWDHQPDRSHNISEEKDSSLHHHTECELLHHRRDGGRRIGRLGEVLRIRPALRQPHDSRDIRIDGSELYRHRIGHDRRRHGQPHRRCRRGARRFPDIHHYGEQRQPGGIDGRWPAHGSAQQIRVHRRQGQSHPVGCIQVYRSTLSLAMAERSARTE